MNYRKYTIFSIVFLFFLSMLVMLKQLKSHQYFSCFTSDAFQYTSWASQFIDALREGIIYPRWTPLNFWGYGNPTFILYPPLSFYIVAVFYIFSDSLISAMNLTKFFSLFVAATGIFFLVREIYDKKVAFISGIVYVFFPFYIFDTYIGGFSPSSISLMWFPLILFFTLKYIKKSEYLYLLFAGVCYGGLILTHIINAYMFTFIIIAFIIYISISERKPKYLFAIPIVVVTGLAISSAYFIPFLYEKRFINYQTGMEIFPIRYLFILPNYTNNFRYDFFWRALYNEFLSYVILFFVLTILILFFQILISNHLKITKDVNTFNKFFIAVSLCSLFLLFGPSLFLFKTIPFVKYIFPVRWLLLTAFAVLLLCGYFIYILEIAASKLIRYSLLGLLFLMCLLQDYKYISGACSFHEQELFPAKAINWVSWFLPKGINENTLDKGTKLKEKVVVINGEEDYKIVKWESAKRIVEMTANQPIILRIRTFNFPGWTAYIDGLKTEIKTENGTGAILIEMPQGRHTLILKFADTPIVYYSKLISLTSFSGIIVLVIFRRRKVHGHKRKP